MFDNIGKIISAIVGTITILSLIVGLTWNYAHSDATISALQASMAVNNDAVNELKNMMQEMTQKITMLQEQVSALSENVDIKQQFQQKELDGVMNEVKTIEAKAIEPHA